MPHSDERAETQVTRAPESANSLRLAYRDVQTRMLLGQWATNLAGLERRLLDELDQQSGKTPASSNEQGIENG